MNVRYRVELSQGERDELKALLSAGKHAVRKLKRAQILPAADAGVTDEEIATSVGVSGSTIYRTKRRLVATSRRHSAKSLRAERGPAGGNRLFGSTGWACPLDPGAVGR